jgi:small subunit ribosomal protein S6
MKKYESMYIVNPDQTEEVINAQAAKFAEIVTRDGGTVEEIKQWGKRRLAYAINFKNEGYYILMNFQADPAFVKELERNYNNDENVMRYIVVRVEEPKAKEAE